MFGLINVSKVLNSCHMLLHTEKALFILKLAKQPRQILFFFILRGVLKEDQLVLHIVCPLVTPKSVPEEDFSVCVPPLSVLLFVRHKAVLI